MYSTTIWFLVILCCGCMNIAKSNILYRNSPSEVQIRPENERRPRNMPALKSGTRTNLKVVKRRAALIVDEEFDITPYLSHEEKVSEIVVDEENGSGTEALNEKETSQVTFHVSKLNSEYLKTNETTSSTQSLTKAEELEVTEYYYTDQISTLTDSDSSGDGMILYSKNYVTTEATTDSHTIPSINQQEIIPDICMNTTCDSRDLSLSSSDETRIIAEGSNHTLSCNSSNSNNMLYWYKSNGSVHFLQAFGREGRLDLNLPDIKPVQSGKYICVHWVNKQACCNLQSDLQVYEVPLYKYHLIILSLICATCLIICIILSVRQSKSFRSYTQEFVEKHGSAGKQLL